MKKPPARQAYATTLMARIAAMTSGRTVTRRHSGEAAGECSDQDVPGPLPQLLDGDRHRGRRHERGQARRLPPERDGDRGEEGAQHEVDAERPRIQDPV